MDYWVNPVSGLPDSISASLQSAFQSCLNTFIIHKVDHMPSNLYELLPNLTLGSSPDPPHSVCPYATIVLECPITVQFTLWWILHTLSQLRDVTQAVLSGIIFSTSLPSQCQTNLLTCIKMSAPISNLFQVPRKIIHFLPWISSIYFSQHLTQGTIINLLPSMSTHLSCEQRTVP